MAAKFKTVKQLYAQDKDFVLFPNIAQAHTGVGHAVTVTYKRRTYDLAKTEVTVAKKQRRVHQWDAPLCFHVL